MSPASASDRRRKALRPLPVLAAVVALGGCFTDADGRQPDLKSLYFPTALLTSPGRTTLFVANSDFDLQYSGGWVQALDLAALRSDVLVIATTLATGDPEADPCQGRGDNPDAWLNPGPCAPLSVAPYVQRHVAIGAFASGLLLTHDPTPAGGGELDGQANARLFASVRGDPSITYFDIDDDREGATSFQLDCAVQDDGFCGDGHRVGRDSDDALRDIQLPADPVGMAATGDGVAIVTAHQTQAAASLVINQWDSGASPTPYLSYYASNLASGPTEIAAIPEPSFVPLASAVATEARAAGVEVNFFYRPGFALTFRSASELTVLRYQSDEGAVPTRPFVVRSTSIPITTTADGFDSRGIAIRDRDRRQCEEACETVIESLPCLTACAEQVPLQIFMANRSPASLHIGEVESFINRTVIGADEYITSADEEIYFFDSVPLDFGPSRVELGQIVNAAGVLEDRVFAVCFDSRKVFTFDPVRMRVESVIHTGRGPHDIAFDTGVDENGETYSLLYVGYFTDSYFGVVDLDMRRPLTFNQVFASVGTPTPPKESK